MSLSEQMRSLAAPLHEHVLQGLKNAPRPCVLFLAAGDMQRRAVTRHACAEQPESAWNAALDALEKALEAEGTTPVILRADWATKREALPWNEAEQRITATRRNYFRQGLALDPGYETAFTEQELNANAMLYSGGDNPKGLFNVKNSARYCRRRFGRELPELGPETRVELFGVQGAFCKEDGTLHMIGGTGLEAGRRDIAVVDAETVRKVVVSGAAWLARQCGPDGRFNYGFFPCFDRPIPTYNTLRHISSTWALLDVYKLTGNRELRAAAERSVAYLLKTFARHHRLPDGREAVFFEDTESGEIKLGSSGAALLLFTAYTELIHPRRYMPLMKAVARGILHLQQPDGGFIHVLNADLSVKEAFRIVYYDGEAVFGLLRLYALTRDPALLHAAERAFNRFIEKKYWKHHDHWLSYSINELTRYRPEARYFEFGINNFLDHLDFVLQRETAFPTLLELMTAADRMVRRMDDMPDTAELLARVDRNRFYTALEHRAAYLLHSFFWPETAMFFQNPARIAGSFFIRHHAFRTRIDDVEHFLSGLTAYLRYLEEKEEAGGAAASLVEMHAEKEEDKMLPPAKGAVRTGWTSDELAAVTGGCWAQQPPSGWEARGLCVWAPAFEPGQILLVRSGEQDKGLAPVQAQRLLPLASGVVCRENSLSGDKPCLLVADDMNEILMRLAQDARSRFTGKVVGVTGTSGKTSFTTLMAHVLEACGVVGKSRNSANLPFGVAWNLASMPWNAPFQVVEMAVGSMHKNSALTRPHVAVVLNVAPAHLIYWKTTAGIARMKSRIFDAAEPGGSAVLNRDCEHYDLFRDAAQKKDLAVLGFGEHAEADVRLTHHSADGMRFTLEGKEYALRLATPGRHSAMNVLAAAAVLKALDLPVADFLDRFVSFTPPEGRGRILDLHVDGKAITLIDDAYNANPASMSASLETLALTRNPSGSDLVILGDMLELGPDSARYHAALAEPLARLQPSRLMLCGEETAVLREAVEDNDAIRCCWFPDVETLLKALPSRLQEGDRVLVKGSHGSKVWKVVEDLKRRAEKRPFEG